jgi:hypothetical protein
MGEDGESLTTSSIHIKGHPKNDDVSSSLLYKKERAIKKEKKGLKREEKIYEIYIKKEKKEKQREEKASPTWPPQNTKVPPDSIKNSPLLYLCLLPPGSMVHTHSLCVWPSLGANLRWTFYNQAAATTAPKLPSTNAAGKNTQACKGK